MNSTDTAQSCIMRGIENTMDGDLSAAIEEYTHAIELDPKNADAYGFRGGVYSDLGEWDKAISDHTHAIALRQKDTDYFNRGCSYFMSDKFSEARSDLEFALQLNPDNIEARHAIEQLAVVER